MPQTESPRVGIVTGEQAPDLTDEGQALRAALRDRGFAAEAVRWDDPEVGWSGFDAALLRSCWGYHENLPAFRSWLGRVEDSGVTVRNPPAAVRWNSHKFYLRDLESAGVPVLSTAFVEAGSDADLSAILDGNGWAEAVVKPAVGTSSTGVWRTAAETAAADQERFETMVADSDVLVQRFAPEVTEGERSLVFFEGSFSHATSHSPADDDFRTHPSFGGTTEAYTPDEAVVEQSRAVLSTAARQVGVPVEALTYARVDGVEREGTFHLMELELIEPFLSLSAADGAVERFADAVAASLEVPGIHA